jgi:DNA-binding response OmpR family regulator
MRRYARVLVIDDHEDSAETLGELLALEGHEVEIALDGRIGVEQAVRFRPHVIICDLQLPKLDGFAVARTLRRELGTSLALVAYSGYAGDFVRRSVEAGFDHFILKPADPRELLALVSQICRGAPDPAAAA